MSDSDHGTTELLERADDNASDDEAGAVVETKIVSPKGARVTETVFVLSSRASRQLEIRGEIPARRISGSGWRPTNRQ
jgi:hypothetical protein